MNITEMFYKKDTNFFQLCVCVGAILFVYNSWQQPQQHSLVMMGTNTAGEKFCLRWNDFESNISVAFREIREEKDFFDYTLSCGERQIQAHKIILSACSPFFRTILKQNPHQHPLLYLKRVEFTDLQAVLNLMYHGEVNIAQTELNSFLAVAGHMQVKGLTEGAEGPGNTKKKTTEASQQPKQKSFIDQRLQQKSD